jgi:DNA-binding transcriptional regulator YiaG
MRWSAHRTGRHEASVATAGCESEPVFRRHTRGGLLRQQCTGTNFGTPSRARTREGYSAERGNMANATPALNPNPPKLVTGAQIKAARALLGWRRVDLAAAAGLHRNAVAYWEGQPRMPRREPFACQKMRAALLMAGVVTVSTPAPGVCLFSAGPRRTAEPSASPVSMAPDPERGGHRLKTAFNGRELCTMHSGLAVSTAQEQGNRSTAPDCEPGTETSEVQA